MKIIRRTGRRLLCSQGVRADTFRRRALGLMFLAEWSGFDGLLLSPCNAIHTCFMRMPIDLCFLDRDGIVLKTVHGMKPWRFALGGTECRDTLELPAGTLKAAAVVPGDPLDME